MSLGQEGAGHIPRAGAANPSLPNRITKMIIFTITSNLPRVSSKTDLRAESVACKNPFITKRFVINKSIDLLLIIQLSDNIAGNCAPVKLKRRRLRSIEKIKHLSINRIHFSIYWLVAHRSADCHEITAKYVDSISRFAFSVPSA